MLCVSSNRTPVEAIVSLMNHNPEPFATEFRHWLVEVVNRYNVSLICFEKLESGPIGTK